MKVNIGVLVSGGGTNLQALIDAEKAGQIPSGRLALVLSSRADAYALKRAEAAGIRTVVVERRSFRDLKDYDAAILEQLRKHDIQIVVMAGFLSILGDSVIEAYAHKIINVHPSLLPAFGGECFYGLRVHQAALERGVKVTGATVHYVNGIPDGGEIIFQKPVEVREGDTPETLQRRVMEEAEWKLLPAATELVCKGELA